MAAWLRHTFAAAAAIPSIFAASAVLAAPADKAKTLWALVRELAGLAEYEAGSMLVDEVTVFASKLTSDGPVYEVLARAPLAE